jgi:hypothetical protein
VESIFPAAASSFLAVAGSPFRQQEGDSGGGRDLLSGGSGAVERGRGTTARAARRDAVRLGIWLARP